MTSVSYIKMDGRDSISVSNMDRSEVDGAVIIVSREALRNLENYGSFERPYRPPPIMPIKWTPEMTERMRDEERRNLPKALCCFCTGLVCVGGVIALLVKVQIDFRNS